MAFGSAWGKRGSRAAALAGVSLLAFNTAFAQPADVQSATARPAGAVNVSVPAGSLESGLLSLGRQTNLRMLYPSNLTTGKRTAGVNGQMSPQQAVTQLLAGTGLRASFTGRNTVQVSGPSTPAAGGALPAGAIALDTIDVQGASNPNSTMTPMPAYAGGQVATGGQLGMLGNRSVMNTPFSQTNYTNKTIQDQQARTIVDVLANEPSVIMSTKSGGAADIGVIRGFSQQGLESGRSLNGLSGMAPLAFPSTDYIERVEVLRGPSALLNGNAVAGNIGGTVNLVTKKAGDESLTQLTTRYMSNSQFGTHIDVGRRFGDNKEFGVRFNGSLDGGHTPVDGQTSRFGTAALKLDYRGERVRLSADLAHQSQELNPNFNAISLFATPGLLNSLTKIPEAPSSRKALAPTWAGNSYKSTMGMVQGEADILENVTAYAAIGTQWLDTKNIGAFGGELNLIDQGGTAGFPSVARSQRYDILSMQGGLRGKVETGPVGHALSVDLSRLRWQFGLTSVGGAVLPAGTIYNLVFPAFPTVGDPGKPHKTTDTVASSIGIADTLSFFDERIQFTAGIRYQQVVSHALDAATGRIRSTYDSDAWTPAFALVVKPQENVSLYANYIEALQPGTIVGAGYTNTGNVFPPFTSKQYETGVKVDWGTVTTTLGVFQIAQPSAIAIPGTGGEAPTMALNGEQRNRGIELNSYGELWEGVRLLGGITLLDARQTKTANGAFDGERAAAAPNFRAVIGGEWDTPFIQSLTLIGRITYTSDVAVANIRPDLTVPSWTQLDLGARYVFDTPWNGKPVIIRFNVDNVFDQNYWKVGNSVGYLYRSDPRTFRLSTTFKF